jgi:hypothetical protein
LHQESFQARKCESAAEVDSVEANMMKRLQPTGVQRPPHKEQRSFGAKEHFIKAHGQPKATYCRCILGCGVVPNELGFMVHTAIDSKQCNGASRGQKNEGKCCSLTSLDFDESKGFTKPAQGWLQGKDTDSPLIAVQQGASTAGKETESRVAGMNGKLKRTIEQTASLPRMIYPLLRIA